MVVKRLWLRTVVIGVFVMIFYSASLTGQASLGSPAEQTGLDLSGKKWFSVDLEDEINRLKDALDTKDLPTKLWAIRRLARHPQHISGPILMEQFNRQITSDTLITRSVIVYCLGQMQYLPAIPQLVKLLKMDITKYGWAAPEVFEQDLKELRRRARGLSDKDLRLTNELRDLIANTRQKMIENYDQKLNWGLLHLRTMEVLGKLKVKEATDDLVELIVAKEIPIFYMAVDTLKLVNDPKASEILNKGIFTYNKRTNIPSPIIYSISETSSPYRKDESRQGTEWLKKSLFTLVAEEVNKPGQTNDCLIKALNIMDMLGRANCQIYDFVSQNNLMKEFMDLTNLLKANNPEVMLYDHDLIIKYIKDELQMKASYNIFGDVLKPVPVILVPSGPVTPTSESSKPQPPDKEKPPEQPK